jgi:hypothetical protein
MAPVRDDALIGLQLLLHVSIRLLALVLQTLDVITLRLWRRLVLDSSLGDLACVDCDVVSVRTSALFSSRGSMTTWA